MVIEYISMHFDSLTLEYNYKMEFHHLLFLFFYKFF